MVVAAWFTTCEAGGEVLGRKITSPEYRAVTV
jgi:hypothetical protein